MRLVVFAAAIAMAASGCAVAPPNVPGVPGPSAPQEVVLASVEPILLPPPSQTPPPFALPSSASPAPSTPSTPSPITTPAPIATPTATPTAPQVQAVDCRKQKCVALTFDDGPLAPTAGMLALLKKEKVHATFFVVGQNVKANPGLVKQMAAQGHVVGNHSYNHPQFPKMTKDRIRSQLTTTSSLIEKATGTKVTLMRPPYGASNSTIKSIEKSLGLTQILWSVDPEDWRDRDASVIAKRVLAQVRPGSIVLSHDIYPTTRDAYKTIIPALRKKGYVLVTVPQLLGKTKPGVSYSELR